MTFQAAAYGYATFDVVTGESLATALPLSEVSFSDPLSEPGSLEATLVPAPQTSEHLRGATEPGRACLYVLSGRDVVWHGIIVARPWDPATGTLRITAAQASAWLKTRLIHRTTSSGKPGPWTFNGADQYEIVRKMVAWAASHPGCPDIETGGTGASGVKRDLTLNPQEFPSVFDVISQMAASRDGFDWEIAARLDGNRPVWVLELAAERSRSGEPLLFESTPHGGNILSWTWDEDVSDAVSRVFALGDGQPPSAPMGASADPGLDGGYVLLREKTITVEKVKKSAVLRRYAEAERLASAVPVKSMELDVRDDSPPAACYATGRRARLIIRDTWVDIDLPVRITDRTVRDASAIEAGKVTVTVDLADQHRSE